MAAVPANYSFKSILVAGQGLNDTMHAWGDALLLQGGKQRTSLTQDLSTAYLSWWNDNGAYYYHHTETGKNYEQTIKDQQAYIQTLNLPVRAIQFDSWWYYERESDGALMLWEPMPSVFPDLMTPWPGIPLVLHSEWEGCRSDVLLLLPYRCEGQISPLPLGSTIVMSTARASAAYRPPSALMLSTTLNLARLLCLQTATSRTTTTTPP